MLREREREKNIGGETFDRFRKIVYICNDISFFKRKESCNNNASGNWY